jgi:hypothetical protein
MMNIPPMNPKASTIQNAKAGQTRKMAMNTAIPISLKILSTFL